jgi:hypothetical protein
MLPPSTRPVQNLFEARHADLAFQAPGLQLQGVLPQAAQAVVAPALVIQ